jgi:hypothetical protein
MEAERPDSQLTLCENAHQETSIRHNKARSRKRNWLNCKAIRQVCCMARSLLT